MIRLSDLTKTFRSVPVVDGLDLHILEGDRVALIGANGAGKTSLIRCLLGEYAHEGDCRIDGLAPRSNRAETLSCIAFVPQTPPPLRMPVAELLRFAVTTAAADARAVVAIAGELGLDMADVAARPFVKLSGGQKQKLLIALALGRNARFLIMDEPTANLDPQARAHFLTLLAQRPATCMLISSHRLDEIAPLVNRLIEMERGRIVLDDRVGDGAAMAIGLTCRIRLCAPDTALASQLARQGFIERDGVLTGAVPAAERWRFVSSLSRHAGALESISWSTTENDHAPS
ncbi:MAG: ABC transporter ATP-binding protein [Bacteroidota bacterium]